MIAGLKVAVVLLAAGLSRRMGKQNKLLIEIGGQPLIRRMAKMYLSTRADVYVVLGHEAEQVRAALIDLPLSFVDNPHFAEGQGTSVRAGLDSIAADYDTILIALADQAALTAEDISDLIRAFADSDRDRILIPYYLGARGNPVVFPSAIIAEIQASGHNAAHRNFIDGNSELTRRYDAPNDHFVIDIDTPDDLRTYENASRLKYT